MGWRGSADLAKEIHDMHRHITAIRVSRIE